MEAMAMLCDFAQVHEGKLNIIGANVNRLWSPAIEPPLPVSFSLAVMVTVPWTATNQPHKVTVELVYDDGEHGAQRVEMAPEMPGQPADEVGMIVAQFNVGRSPEMANGEQTLLPLALPFPAFPMPGLGAYYFEVKVDGVEAARVPFAVNSVNSMPFGGGYPRSA